MQERGALPCPPFAPTLPSTPQLPLSRMPPLPSSSDGDLWAQLGWNPTSGVTGGPQQPCWTCTQPQAVLGALSRLPAAPVGTTSLSQVDQPHCRRPHAKAVPRRNRRLQERAAVHPPAQPSRGQDGAPSPRWELRGSWLRQPTRESKTASTRQPRGPRELKLGKNKPFINEAP